jgi:hypothetical protein
MILKTSRVGDRALVSFHDSSDSVCVYLPSKATLGNVAGALAEVARAEGESLFVAGVVAAEFVAAVKPDIRPRIVPTTTSERQWVSDHRIYVVGGLAYRQMEVSVRSVSDGVENHRSLFVGPVSAFPEWAGQNRQNGLEAAVQKVVRFKYGGGSKPGQYRTVRVEDVERDGNGVAHICGLDLEQADLRGAYRKYSVEKIVGDVEVVN